MGHYKPVHRRDYDSLQGEVELAAFEMEARNAANMIFEKQQYSPAQFSKRVAEILGELANQKLGISSQPSEPQGRDPNTGRYVAKEDTSIFSGLSDPHREREETLAYNQEWNDRGKAMEPGERVELMGLSNPRQEAREFNQRIGSHAKQSLPNVKTGRNPLDRNWSPDGSNYTPAKGKNIFGE